MKRLLLFAMGLWLALPLQAQVKEEIFESFKLQERRGVKYYIPEDYNPDKRYPLVIVLDEEYLFDQVVATSKFYSRFQGLPESLIVGISQSKGDLRAADCEYELTTGLPAEKGKKLFRIYWNGDHSVYGKRLQCRPVQNVRRLRYHGKFWQLLPV